jgi:hypothetical protein
VAFCFSLLISFIYFSRFVPRFSEGDCVIAYTNPDKNVLLSTGIRPFQMLKINKVDSDNRRYLVEIFTNSRLSNEKWMDFLDTYSLGIENKIKCSRAFAILGEVYQDQ